MKYLLSLVCAAIVLFVACQPAVTPGTPAVTISMVGTGDTMRLTWAAITDAQGYYVYLDGVKNTITTTTYDVVAPTKLIKVTAYNGSEESDPWEKSTAVTVTSSVEVYGTADPNVNHAYGFNTTSGTCLAYDFTAAANYPSIDFVAENTTPTPMSFWASNQYTVGGLPINGKGNATAASTATSFDDLKVAAHPGVYSNQFPIATGGIYSQWIDITDNGYSADDHFAKVSVEAISGNKVTIKAGYQLIGGLRWLISQ